MSETPPPKCRLGRCKAAAKKSYPFCPHCVERLRGSTLGAVWLRRLQARLTEEEHTNVMANLTFLAEQLYPPPGRPPRLIDLREERENNTRADWLALGREAKRVLGADQSKWWWKLFQEKKPKAVALLEKITKRGSLDLFSTRLQSLHEGLISQVFAPLP